MSEVGKKLKEERLKKHLTQVQVFKKTGINNKTLSGYENGVSYPDFETLKLLASLYEVTTDHLLGIGNEGNLEVSETEIDLKRKQGLEYIKQIKDEKTLDLAIELLEKLAKE